MIYMDIQVRNWTCGDGCCDDYWLELYINGEEVATDHDMDPMIIIKVLNAIGHDVTYEKRIYRAKEESQ